MNKNLIVCYLGVIGAVGLAGFLCLRVADLHRENQKIEAALRQALATTRPAEPIELADVMEKLQRHSNKLYFAGQQQNWELAAFYLEEIEETVENISDKNVMEGQINISGLMQGLLLPEVEELEKTVKAKDQPGFFTHFQTLTGNCNACHVASQHPFIVIQEPRTPVMDNQLFEVRPQPTAASQ